MLSFFSAHVDFAPQSGRESLQHISVDISAAHAGPTARVLLVLNGFDIRYKGDDHHMRRVVVMPELDQPGPYGAKLAVRVRYGLRDDSGNWDDKYTGSVDIGVIVVDDAGVSAEMGEQAFPYITGAGPQTIQVYTQPHQPATDTLAFIRGFDIAFDGEDHHVLSVEARVQSNMSTIKGSVFDALSCTLGLRDGSGFWDDAYGGVIGYASLRVPTGLVAAQRGTLSGSAVDRGPIVASTTHFFAGDTPENKVFVGQSGFLLEFVGGDHHLHKLISKVRRSPLTATAGGSRFNVEYEAGIRDLSGDWDDQYRCIGQYIVLVAPTPKLAAAGTPPEHVVPWSGGLYRRLPALARG